MLPDSVKQAQPDSCRTCIHDDVCKHTDMWEDEKMTDEAIQEIAKICWKYQREESNAS